MTGLKELIARGRILGWLPIGAAVMLMACGRTEIETGQVLEARIGTAPARADFLKEPKQHSENRSLAYEHTVSIELPKERIPARINEVRGACGSRTEIACTLLDVSMQEQFGVPSGRIRVRLAPSAVETMVEIASQNGRITSRNTHAEDLAEPISDTERQLSILSSHRDRLSQFLERKDLKVDQVVSLSKEISSTQAQIDSLNTQKSNLLRRVATELLTLEFSTPQEAYRTAQTPIQDAIRSFGSDSKEAAGYVIRFVAILLPWLVIIVPGMVLLRLFWRRITRWLARRELTR